MVQSLPLVSWSCLLTEVLGSTGPCEVDIVSRVNQDSFGIDSLVSLAACILSSNSVSSMERDFAFMSTINVLAETRLVK